MPFPVAYFLAIILSFILPILVFYPGMMTYIFYLVILPILFVTNCVKLDLVRRNQDGVNNCWQTLFIILFCIYPFAIPLGIVAAHIAFVFYYAFLPFFLIVYTSLLLSNWIKKC